MDLRRGRRNKVVDVSSFWLFEATGDSESGFSFDPAMARANHIEEEEEEEDDDAESCSCGIVPGVREIYSFGNRFGNVDDYEEEEEEEDDDDDDGVVEQKEVNLYKKYCRDEVGKEKKPSSSSSSGVSVENPNETAMNEMEKNRLFWEACLAS